MLELMDKKILTSLCSNFFSIKTYELFYLQKQLQAYMAWINSQLAKKPGARLVEDLQNDTRDGVAFLDLISVIGEKILFKIITTYRKNLE